MGVPAHGRDTGIAGTLAEAGAGAVVWAWQLSRPVRTLTGAAVLAAADTALRLAPPGVLAALTDRGRCVRAALERHVAALLRLVVRRVVAAVLETTDLTALVRGHVDLDAVAAELDLDAIVARVDLDAIVRRIDLDAAVAQVDLDAAVARVDIDAIARRIDLDAAVARVDLDAAVARVDIDAIARRIDLDAIVRRVDVDAVARTLDLDALAARIDPDPVVARADIDAVIARVDLVGIAREVIDAVDLPEIVRHSTGTLTSDTIRGVRREAMQADEVVAGFLDRLLRRPRPVQQQAPAPP